MNRAKGTQYWYGSLIMDQADATGLSYRRNRYYAPVSGQFTQQDPIGIAGGLNLYGYAGGDPINFSDPFGLAACPGPACVAVGAGAGVGLLTQLAFELTDDQDGVSVWRLGVATAGGAAAGYITMRNPGTGLRHSAGVAGQQSVLSVAEGALKGEISPADMMLNAISGGGGELLGNGFSSYVVPRVMEGMTVRGMVEGFMAGVTMGQGTNLLSFLFKDDDEEDDGG